MRLAVLVLACLGCGRFDFAELQDASPDGKAALACSSGTASSVTITGRTFRYTSFMNAVAPLDTVSVDLLREDDSIAATTTSDAAGNYTLVTEPGTLHFRFKRSTYEMSLIYSDLELDHDIAATAQPVFAIGDGPMWQTTAINSIYSTVSVARDTMKGTINIGVRDCDGTPIEGVTFTVEPPPGAATYQGADGMPDASLTATVGPYAHFIGLNAEPGPTHITASKGDQRFGELSVVVVAQSSMIGILHGY